VSILARLTGPFAVVLLVVTACVQETRSQVGIVDTNAVTLERATNALHMTRFAKLGIAMMLPQETINKRIDDGRSWQDTYGCKTLRFSLVRVPMSQYNRGDLNAIAGHVNVYTHPQYLQWTRSPSSLLEGGELILRGGGWTWTTADEQFDVIETRDSGTNVWGLTQTTYRIDRKAKDGRVLQAMITRMDYTDDVTIREQDLTTITNVLNSVHFTP
jgi:hypothetical protein